MARCASKNSNVTLGFLLRSYQSHGLSGNLSKSLINSFSSCISETRNKKQVVFLPFLLRAFERGLFKQSGSRTLSIDIRKTMTVISDVQFLNMHPNLPKNLHHPF